MSQVPSPLVSDAEYKYGQRWNYVIIMPATGFVCGKTNIKMYHNVLSGL